MMRRHVITIAVFVFVMLVPLAFIPVHVFQITGLREDTVLYRERVTPGFRFSLGFMHSVEQCPVWDHLTVDDDYRMITYATEFWSSRTGQPYAPFGDETFRAQEDHYIIENMHRFIPAVYQWVDARYDNTIRFGDGREIKLASLAGNTLLSITIERMGCGYYIYHHVKQCIT